MGKTDYVHFRVNKDVVISITKAASAELLDDLEAFLDSEGEIAVFGFPMVISKKKAPSVIRQIEERVLSEFDFQTYGEIVTPNEE